MASIRKKRNKFAVRICKKGHPVIYKSFNLRSSVVRWAKAIESDMDRKIFEDYLNASTATLKDILIRYRDEVTSKKKGQKSETYKINKLINNRFKHLVISLV